MVHTFSGSTTGRPAWAETVENGTDVGFFGPGSAAFAVHGGMSTMVAGIRALLMQTLHPGAMAGVHDWSRYQEDPLGRLSGTVKWVMLVTFADTATARTESTRVGRFHDRVAGTYVDARGETRPYSAGDPELLSWVHLVFTDAFLRSNETWGGPIPGGADQYVREWTRAGELVGVTDPPRSEAELRAQLQAFADNGTLLYNERVAEAVRFIRRPPLAKSMLPAYRIMFAGAVATLPREYRRMLHLRRSWLPVVTATRVVLGVVRLVLGPRSGAQITAEARAIRLGAGVTS
jgi:uncharacterized protein (DUF2236 family)